MRPLWAALALALLLLSLPLYQATATPSSPVNTPADTPADTPASEQIFLPYVAMSNCQLDEAASTLAQRFERDPNQRREGVQCNAKLAQVARARALDMATRAYFDHKTPDGLGPNELARAAGCHLPDFYPGGEANSIESIAGGYASADEAWDALMESPSHRPHLLAEDDFYRDQTDYGVGYVYAPGSPFTYYWVVLTAEC